MATHLEIDPALMARAIALSDERSEHAVVTRALHEYIARRDQRKLVDLFGQIEWDDDVDSQAERSRAAPGPTR